MECVRGSSRYRATEGFGLRITSCNCWKAALRRLARGFRKRGGVAHHPRWPLRSSIARIACLAAAFAAAAPSSAAVIELAYDGSDLVLAILRTEGAEIAGAEVVMSFESARILPRANGKPDCTVNEDIHKGASSFAFQPSGCAGASCTVVKALILSLENVTPIPDGSVLFACRMQGSRGGLGCAGAGASDPAGNPVTVRCGSPPPATHTWTRTRTFTATRTFTFTPTSTPTPTRTPTPTPTPDPFVWIEAGSTALAPGGFGTLEVRFAVVDLRGSTTVGVQNDLGFADGISVARAGDAPDCRVNRAIGREARFSFLPAGCLPGECTGIRALLLSFTDFTPIPDRALLYSCRLTAGPDTATGRYPILVFNTRASAANGTPIAAAGRNGSVVVGNACSGDCDSDGQVTVDELLRAVNVALGLLALDTCSGADSSGDGVVTINELLRAVNLALVGCARQNTPVRSATPARARRGLHPLHRR